MFAKNKSTNKKCRTLKSCQNVGKFQENVDPCFDFICFLCDLCHQLLVVSLVSPFEHSVCCIGATACYFCSQPFSKSEVLVVSLPTFIGYENKSSTKGCHPLRVNLYLFWVLFVYTRKVNDRKQFSANLHTFCIKV